MRKTQVHWSPQVFSILSNYPQWQDILYSALHKPLFDRNYCPEVIEIFDQHGLLAGRVHGCFSYECSRTFQSESEFIAWLFDGELAVFYVGSELVINRLQMLCEAVGEFL